MNHAIATKYRGVALLLLRLGVGLIFIVAGWDKLMDISGPQAMFADLGIPLAGLMAWVVAIVEFVGGLMVLAGAYIRIPTPLLAVIMVVAIFTVKLDQGFGAMRLDLMLLFASLALFILGSGKYSVDHMIQGENPKSTRAAS